MDDVTTWVSIGGGFVTIMGSLIGWANSLLKQREASVIAQITIARTTDKAEIASQLASHHAAMLNVMAKDKIDTRNWINGSFMRASEVDANIERLCERMDRFENRLDRVR